MQTTRNLRDGVRPKNGVKDRVQIMAAKSICCWVCLHFKIVSVPPKIYKCRSKGYILVTIYSRLSVFI